MPKSWPERHPVVIFAIILIAILAFVSYGEHAKTVKCDRIGTHQPGDPDGQYPVASPDDMKWYVSNCV